MQMSSNLQLAKELNKTANALVRESAQLVRKEQQMDAAMNGGKKRKAKKTGAKKATKKKTTKKSKK